MNQHDHPGQIRHKGAGGQFKTPMRLDTAPNSTMAMDKIAAIKLSLDDAEFDRLLSGVGEQLLGLMPVGSEHERVAYTIPGRNALSIKYAVWDARGYWADVTEWQLVVIPDTIASTVLPPEFVRCIDARMIATFRLEGPLPGVSV